MNSEVIISAKNLSKKYALYNGKSARLKEALSVTGKKYHREHKALDDVSFEMKRGDCLAIIGKNGSGKSTLLQIIAGLMQPTHGHLNVRGKVSALVQLGATFNPEFTGLDNVKLYATALGYSPQELKEKLSEILQFADIEDFIYQKVKTYSSGMRARLAFSVVVSLDPEILIVDEVLSVGDMFFKQKCITKLKCMIEKGLTLFFVSHSLNDVKALCKNALYLDKGKMVTYGNVNEVLNLYQNGLENTDKKFIQKKISSKKVESKSIQADRAAPATSNFGEGYICPNLSKSTERSGNKVISYYKLALLDHNLKESNKISMFKKIKISAYFNVNALVSSTLDFGLVCRDSRGYDVFVLNSTNCDIEFEDFKIGKTYIWEIDIAKNLLSPGVYNLNIGAKPQREGNEYYDRIFNACVFEVVMPQEMSTNCSSIHGCFFCESEMRFKNE